MENAIFVHSLMMRIFLMKIFMATVDCNSYTKPNVSQGFLETPLIISFLSTR